MAFAVLAGPTRPPAKTPGQNTAAGVRIGLPTAYYELIHPETRRAVEDAAGALERLGAHVEWIEGPDLDPEFAGFRHVWADVAHHHRDLWDNPAVSEEVAVLIDYGRRITGVDYAASRAHADLVRDRFGDALRDVDALLTPATPYPAPRADHDEVVVTGGALDVHRGAPSRLTVPVNEAGLPAVAFPVGTADDGLPVGAQLIGAPYADERLLSIVIAYQDHLDQGSPAR
jgi:aspartyl-tRNA(Asn)/glutamyl-tRNA(Gln) amidotransferase subunit A